MDDATPKVRKVNVFAIIFTLLLCILVIYVIYILLYYSFDDDIKIKNERTAVQLSKSKLESLINGSGINNIPNLNIVTTNPEINKSSDCSKGPVYIGKTGTTQSCIQTCSNASATVLNVRENENYIYEQSTLSVGAYCLIGPRPNCNMNTSHAIMTINSVICRPKFPELVGGPLGNKIVACNNREINDPQNILWDYKYNEKFNPITTIISSVDEVLPDGEYRFQCRFNGVDTTKNQFIPHPYNRLHPIRNYCASSIVAAHPDVKTVFDTTTNTYKCDCGDHDETRVKNIDPNDPTSLCSNVSYEIKVDVFNRKIMTLPYRCFNLFSPISDVGKYLPCPVEQFTRDGTQYTNTVIPFSTNIDAPIEHPQYSKFRGKDTIVYVESSGKILERVD
ncbi:ACH96147.1 pif-2-like protein [Kallithea virus]|uniref:ACH96147.1 pif-2-like protein n=2 Tax=Kallithea virus TaxID=1654582 RepID=A0A1S5VFZ7_9VIRU|nr:ACH96147.1 pif-2-like protein [Kallithea virus]AQN78569.1 ACH96147.1 pif-2-like protein [Kallithea virus]